MVCVSEGMSEKRWGTSSERFIWADKNSKFALLGQRIRFKYLELALYWNSREVYDEY